MLSTPSRYSLDARTCVRSTGVEGLKYSGTPRYSNFFLRSILMYMCSFSVGTLFLPFLPSPVFWSHARVWALFQGGAIYKITASHSPVAGDLEHGATVNMKSSLLKSCVSLSILVSQAAAWGNVGHQTIGYEFTEFLPHEDSYIGLYQIYSAKRT